MPAVKTIEDLFGPIDAFLEEYRKISVGRPIAAFDADGTLWDTDIGENFFKFQADNKLVELPENPWDFYTKWHLREPIPAYVWLAQVNQGQKIEKVREWAKSAVDQYEALPIFPHMKKLIEFLQERNFEIYIVTASVKWAVEPAAEHLGIDRDHVIGIETEVKDGLVSTRAILPVTWREGKRTALLWKTGKRHPVFAAGNTTGDLALLQSASHIAFAHTTVPEAHGIYTSEKDLLEAAKENDWFWWEGQ